MYAEHFVSSDEQRTQREPLPGQVRNSAGGYTWAIDDWARLDRFLILGTDGGSYYATERALTVENAGIVLRCLTRDGPRVVQRIVEMSESGRAPKARPILFALALAQTTGDPATRAAVHAALPRVCRIPTHLFEFLENVGTIRARGQKRPYAKLSHGLRRAIASWYQRAPADRLAYHAIKYRQRGGWTHRDVLRLVHPRFAGVHQAIARWIVKGELVEDVADAALAQIATFERAARSESVQEIVALIRDARLPREAIPTQWLTEPAIWEALLAEMPMTAMVRNLGVMSKVGLLVPGSQAEQTIVARLGDAEWLRKARIHPIAILAALKTYASGHGARGQGTWEPCARVVDALDAAFYAAFGNVPATGKRILLALDVSGSMHAGAVAGIPGLTPRAASAAMALVTAAVEPRWATMAFAREFVPFPLSPRERLDDVIDRMNRMLYGATDCALPMIWASERRLAFDLFVVYTDSETWYGKVHPAVALRQYRERSGIPARLVVVGMVANGFSIADPNDAGMLDVVGFDTATPALIADFATDGAVTAAPVEADAMAEVG